MICSIIIRCATPSTLAAIGVVLVTSGAAAQQNERDDWLRRIDVARERYDAFAAHAAAAFRDTLATHRNTLSSDVFRLDDPTLRPGDIVVTPTSLLLFKGARSHVCETGFERVDASRAHGLPHARALRAILCAGSFGGLARREICDGAEAHGRDRRRAGAGLPHRRRPRR
jgi:hypothetical protein